MVQQAESIKLFVEPCTHWVIINEPNANLDEWQDLLAPYYSRHRLKLRTHNLFLFPKLHPDHDGYYIQQILKILISQDIKDDYLLLDSKNIFLKKTDTDIFKNQTGNGSVFDFSKREDLYYDNRKIEYYSNKLNVPYDPVHLNPLLPFVIKKSVMEKINKDEFADIIKWFSESAKMNAMSEFLLFSVLCKKYNHTSVLSNNHTARYYWTDEVFRPEDQTNILGLHRNWVNNASPETLETVNNFLKSLGFKNLFEVPKIENAMV